MTLASRWSRLAPWTALIVAPTAWLLHHQVLSDMLHFDCHLGGATAGLVAAALAVAALLGAGYASWRARRDEGASEGRYFVAILGTLFTGVSLFAIALQTLATLILPGCGA